MPEFVITKLGHLGDGLASGTIVPGALPGERVELAEDGTPRIRTSSPDRVAPPCAHAKSCGGCAVQHASDPLVSRWKQAIVTEALHAHGIDAEVAPPLISPQNSRRRASFSGRRTKKGALVGFHARRSNTVIAVPSCTVITKPISAVVPFLQEMTLAGGSRKGEISFLVTETLAGLDVSATGGKALDLALRHSLTEIGARARLARLVWGEDPVAQWELPLVALGPARVPLPSGAFLQATAHGEATLVHAVRQIVGPAKRVADLFCGCGTFALPLAHTAEVLAVENARPQIDALTTGWRTAQGLKRIDTEVRDLFRNPLLPAELKRCDAVVIDPPRAGASAQIAQLAASDVPTIAMVSCNPQTFARDAATLIAAGFVMSLVQPVDQFRWSPHVELIAGFTRP